MRKPDDGTFRKLFLRALAGEAAADANGDGYVIGTELGLHLSQRMANLTQNRQTPRYGKLRDADYDRGEFVFSVSRPGTPWNLRSGSLSRTATTRPASTPISIGSQKARSRPWHG